MNVREYEMYENILPDLQNYLSENCTGRFDIDLIERKLFYNSQRLLNSL